MKEEVPTQREVTEFYNQLVFPSRTKDSPYLVLASEIMNNDCRVGDFGCGQSVFYTVFRHLRVPPVFLDISHNALKTIDYGNRIRADLCGIPLRDGSLDVVFCIGVIHHLPDMQAAVRELSRVVARGGKLVIGVYAPQSKGARIKRIYDRIPSRIAKSLVFQAAALFLWTEHRARYKLSWRDAQKRVADLLDTPIVHYLPPQLYENMGTQAGLKVMNRSQISGMTILGFSKT